MTQKHTPEPWEVTKRRNTPYPDITAIESSTGVSMVVASVGGWTPEEAQANAVLMVAALNLLAACKAGLEASVLRQADHTCHNDACSDAERSAFIRSAIAKAEGAKL